MVTPSMPMEVMHFAGLNTRSLSSRDSAEETCAVSSQFGYRQDPLT